MDDKTDARQQWLRSAAVLQILICEDMYDITEERAQISRPPMSRRWMHVFFSAISLLWGKAGQREEIATLSD